MLVILQFVFYILKTYIFNHKNGVFKLQKNVLLALYSGVDSCFFTLK